MNDVLLQILSVVGPALLTFLAGHYHVILPAPNAPQLPIGKGGVLQILGKLLGSVLAHPTATPADKVSAAAKVVEIGSVFGEKPEELKK